jgi:hypothetical protein
MTGAPGVPRFVFTTELIARAADHTDLVYRVAKPRAAKDRRVLEAMWDPLRAVLTSTASTLIELAGADARERAASRLTEPEAPPSVARYLSEPVTAAGEPILYLSDDAVTPVDAEGGRAT